MLNIFKAEITMDTYEKREAHDNEVTGTLLLNYDQIIHKIQTGKLFSATTIAVCLQHIISNMLRKKA